MAKRPALSVSALPPHADTLALGIGIHALASHSAANGHATTRPASESGAAAAAAAPSAGDDATLTADDSMLRSASGRVTA